MYISKHGSICTRSQFLPTLFSIFTGSFFCHFFASACLLLILVGSSIRWRTFLRLRIGRRWGAVVITWLLGWRIFSGLFFFLTVGGGGGSGGGGGIAGWGLSCWSRWFSGWRGWGWGWWNWSSLSCGGLSWNKKISNYTTRLLQLVVQQRDNGTIICLLVSIDPWNIADTASQTQSCTQARTIHWKTKNKTNKSFSPSQFHLGWFTPNHWMH